jgi:hypothetical protein
MCTAGNAAKSISMSLLSKLGSKPTPLLSDLLLPSLLLLLLQLLLPLLLPGIEFAGVHDSFWTHAGTVPRMNELLRRKFLDLHSQGLLEELVVQLQVSNGFSAFTSFCDQGFVSVLDW